MRFQRSIALFRAAAVLLVPVAGIAVAPYSGAPFVVPMGLGTAPSTADDAENAEMMIHRVQKSKLETDSASPHACDMGDQADKEKCLTVEGRGCMWTRMETRDPLRRVQASTAYCLPCRLDKEEIPCWNPGAWVNGKLVLECKMSCMHQQRIWQPQYACSDDTGFISQAQCLSRGAESGSKCMYIAYKDKNNKLRSGCGPCELAGSGGWGCPANGAAGPEDGSKVIGCFSQCDVLCAGPPACPPTVAPPPPPPPPSPGILQVSSPANEMLSAPAPFLFVPPDPNAAIEAVRVAAEKAGWKVATTPPPKTYWPLIYYRQPMDFMFTTGPPPDLIEKPRPEPTADALLQTNEKPYQPLLRSLRRQSYVGQK